MPMGQFAVYNAAILAGVSWPQIFITPTPANPTTRILPRWHGQLVSKLSALTAPVIWATPFWPALPAAGPILSMPILAAI